MSDRNSQLADNRQLLPMIYLARCEGRQPVTRLTERERFLRAEFVALACRRSGHRPVRRVIGLQGACCTGVGEGPPVCIRRFQEARPRPSWGDEPQRIAAEER